MNYTLNQLRVYLKVVQTLSITKAADELHLTQPAVSIQLKNFQQQFPYPLTEVVNRRIFITDFGKEVALTAERIIEEAGGLEQIVQIHKGALTGKLKLSVVSTGKYIAPYFISGFMKSNSGVTLMMDVTNKAQVLASLERNEVDFSLVSVLPENFVVDKVELMQNKLFVVGNGEQKFSGRVHDKKVFERIPLIYREQGSGTRHVMEKFILKNRLPVTKKMELTSNEAVKQAVIAGLGYSIMPLIGIKNELQIKQLQIIPIKGFPIKSTWYLIWQKGKQLSPVANAYLKYLRTEKQQIIDKHFDWFEKFS